MNDSKILMFALTLTALLFTACQPDDDNDFIDDDLVDINDIDPTGNNNGGNQENLAQLGRLLFWDPILSGHKDVACATCHHPNFGYSDGRALGIGVGGVGLGPDRIDAVADNIGLIPRNAPTIINTAFNGINEDGDFNPNNAPMFWDNRANSLEEQALGPIESFIEMRGHAFNESLALDSIVARLDAIPQYRNLFANAFGGTNPVTSSNMAAAIAAFERTIVATDSPFDRFMAGDQNAMTQAQIRGMNTFNRIGCDDCHSGPMFSDWELHTVGVPDHPLLDETDTGANGDYEFRTPTLRNLSLTGPYFHNGVAEDLEETIRFYITARNFANNNGGGGGPGGGGNNGGLGVNENLNRNDIAQDVRNLDNFNNQDIQDIVRFIEALNDDDFDRSIPQQVPSGLNPGGNIN